MKVERIFTRQFVKEQHRGRWLRMLPSKRRCEFLQERLYHCHDLEAVHKKELHVRELVRGAFIEALRKIEVQGKIYVISVDPQLDGKWHDVSSFEIGLPDGTIAMARNGYVAIYRDEYHYSWLRN